jgi:LuxR family maltose regulon positive regulatory protein
MRRTRQEATFRQWVRALPDALIRQRPVLSVVCAWVLLDAGDYDAVESRLRDAEDLLQAAPEARIIADARQLASLPATIANARAYRAQAQNDLAGTIHYTRLALELLPEKDAYERGTTTALLGLAYWAAGDLDSAYRAFTHGLDQLERGGGLLIRLGGTIVLGQIRTAQGQLRAAADAHHDALRLAMAHGEPLPKGTAEQYLGLADVSFWRGQYAQSEAFMAQGTRLRERASLPGYDHLWCIVAARQKHAAGDTDTALGLLDEAERLYYRSPIPDVRPIGAIRARMLLAANRLPEALDWAHENGLALDAPPDYLQEYASLTRVRVLLAHGRASDAQEVLARLMSTAKAAGRSGSVFEITLLQALAHHAQADLPSALDALWHALTWAEPEGYIRPFVDEGQPMAALLRSAVERGLSGFAQAVLAAFPPHLAPSPDLSPAHPLVEPLSAREAEVLRLLKTELSGPELAELLGVALSTVRTHIKNIYAKLGVTNRRAAVNRAEQLGWM